MEIMRNVTSDGEAPIHYLAKDKVLATFTIPQ